MQPDGRLSRDAFTLIELLFVIGIIGTLAALAFGTIQTASNQGRKVREVAAARTLATAFAGTAADNNGQYMLGYDESAGELSQPDGSVVSGPPAYRYPYRLAPYFNYQMKDTILVNSNAQQVDQSMLTYSTSLNPALGMNSFFVGGNVDRTGAVSYPGECLQRPSLAAASLLVFASAVYDGGGKRINGFYKLTPPRQTAKMWSDAPWSSKSSASDYGNVDGRYGGQAVCAFTDGSVRLLSIDALRDMRLWSNNAAAQGKSDYVVASGNGGGRL